MRAKSQGTLNLEIKERRRKQQKGANSEIGEPAG